MSQQDRTTDLFIIGGGINGCGIARDAAGRGLSVRLAEQGDLACATSGASTKLLHGGLRYLDYLEFRLVREALHEREVLLRAMPHLARPMRFVLPLDPAMRFGGDSPVSRLLARLMPWRVGRRPRWLIRAGLLVYDGLSGRTILPRTSRVRLAGTREGAVLKDHLRHAYEYSDCWVDDARLVVLNARDAAARGADILTRARVVRATREGRAWRIDLVDGRQFGARILVNAAGPWVGQVAGQVARLDTAATVRLVRGSHIVTRRLFDHDKAYFLQGEDGRIVFAIPYEGAFTLIGTTDVDHDGPPDSAQCTRAERDYLLAFVSRYFRRPVTARDVVHSFAGVRPLYDDGAATATAATRDYVLSLDGAPGAPCLNVFGGKITTYRRLAEAAMAKLADHLPDLAPDWTAGVPLPGGDFRVEGVPAQVAGLRSAYPFLTPDWALRLVRAYGTEAAALLGQACSAADLGRAFGATLTWAELDWMMRREWAVTAQDALWRRSKLGLWLDDAQVAAVEAAMACARGNT